MRSATLVCVAGIATVTTAIIPFVAAIFAIILTRAGADFDPLTGVVAPIDAGVVPRFRAGGS